MAVTIKLKIMIFGSHQPLANHIVVIKNMWKGTTNFISPVTLFTVVVATVILSILLSSRTRHYIDHKITWLY